MGFCDAALGEDKSLLVYYLWRSKPYIATFADRVSLLALAMKASGLAGKHSFPAKI